MLINNEAFNPETKAIRMEIVGLDGEPIASEGYLVASYVGMDGPGMGGNTLNDGKSRIWRKTDSAQTFLLTRINDQYFAVEMTAQ